MVIFRTEKEVGMDAEKPPRLWPAFPFSVMLKGVVLNTFKALLIAHTRCRRLLVIDCGNFDSRNGVQRLVVQNVALLFAQAVMESRYHASFISTLSFFRIILLVGLRASPSPLSETRCDQHEQNGPPAQRIPRVCLAPQRSHRWLCA